MNETIMKTLGVTLGVACYALYLFLLPLYLSETNRIQISSMIKELRFLKLQIFMMNQCQLKINLKTLRFVS